MAAKIGPKIEIEGEREYRKQLAELVQATKLMGSEVQVVASQFSGQEKSVESLTAMNEAYQNQIYTLNDLLEVQKKRLQDIAEAYGEADVRTQQAQIEVNKTAAEINRLNGRIDQNSKSVSDLNAGPLANITETLKDKLGGALGLSKDQTEALSGAMSGAPGSLAVGLTTAIGIAIALAKALAEVTKALIQLTIEAAAGADEVLTLSTNYGIATETLQEYKYMAELTDTSVDTITGSITKLTKSMASARGGTGDAADAFRLLGIEVVGADGLLRDANEVFLEAIDHLGYIENATERDALAMTLFGRSAQDLNSLIAAGKDGIAAYAEEAHRMGYVLSEEQLATLGQVDDQMQRINNLIEATKNQIALEMAPAIIELTQEFLDFTQTADWDEIREAVLTVVQAIAEGLKALGETIMSVIELWDKLDSMHEKLTGRKSLYLDGARTAFLTNPLGQGIGMAVAGGKVMHDIVVNITNTMDGRSVGQSTARYVNAENSRIGGSFTGRGGMP